MFQTEYYKFSSWKRSSFIWPIHYKWNGKCNR